VLHNAKERPTRIEDAEWQADTFAERILIEMGYYVDQLSFDFYM
jgi:putative toxin-antitoxin system, toxin component